VKLRIVRWSFVVAAVTTLIAVTSIYWLVVTENGARWLLSKASPYLPSQMSIAGLDGTLLQGLQLSSIRWDDDSLSISVDSVHTQFALLPLLRRNLDISVFDAHTVKVMVGDLPEGGAAEAPFAVDIPLTVLLDAASIRDVRVEIDDEEYLIDSIDLGGRMSGSDLDISKFDVASNLGELAISGNVRLADPYTASVNGRWALQIPEQPRLDGQINLRGDSSRYDIQHSLTAPYKIATNGWLAIEDSEVRADVENSWPLVDLAMADGRTVSARDGRLHLIGTIEQFVFEGSATVDMEDIPPFLVSLNGDSDTNRFSIEALSISSEWGRLLASGTVTIAPEPNWDLGYEIFEVDPALVNSILTGRLQLRGRSVGSIDNQKIIASAAVDSLAGNLNGYPVTGSAALSYADESLRFTDARINVGSNHAVFNGSYGAKLDVNATLRLPDISQLIVEAAGSASGDLRLRTNADHVALKGNLIADSLLWNGYSVDHLESRFDLPAAGAGEVFVRARNASIDQLRLESVAIDGDGTAESHGIAATIDLPVGRSEFRASGRYADEQWTGSLETLTLRGEALGEWALQQETDVAISATALTIDRACLLAASPAGTACIELQYEDSGTLRFSTSISGLPIDALPIDLPEASSITGTIEAEADGEFLDQRLTATANLNIPGLGLRELYEDEEIAADFDVATLNASILDNRLNAKLQLAATDKSAGANASIELANILDRESQITGAATLELSDLSLLSFLYPDVTETSGRVGGKVDISGSLTAPEFVGEIGLQDGAFEVSRAGIAVTEIGLRLQQSEPGRLSLEGSAKSGEGFLSIGGSTTLSSTAGVRTQITLKGDKFEILRLPEWHASTSPSIEVILDDREARISGELGIPDANIVVHEIPDTAVQPSADVIVHRADESQQTTRRELFVDVRTVLGKEVSLSAFGLTTGLEGAVRITGGSKSPYAGFGRLILREGRYKAYGQNLEIERGELVFNGPLGNPTLDVRATRTASDDVVAGIHLTGTPAQPRSEVFSDPVLGDAEALSYLLTGRPLVNANAEQGDMLNQAAFALGLSTAGSVVSQISNELGLDTLAVKGGSGNQQIVAGKSLGNRLLVEYAYGIVDKLGTLLLRYQLNKRLVLESRSGSVNNVDVVYSVKKN
jgi:translocation and assembly module TamB